MALGLIERGEVVLGVLGCPNLPLDAGRGALFSGVRGEPAHVRSLWDADASAREVRVGDSGRASDARLCESVESAHSDQDQSSRIAGLLGAYTALQASGPARGSGCTIASAVSLPR